MSDQLFRQCGHESLSVEHLADGSIAIVDNRIKSVHSLNPSAARVWEACAAGATFDQIQASLAGNAADAIDPVADPAVVRDALAQLQRANLIESDAPLAAQTLSAQTLSAQTLSAQTMDEGRRSMLKRVGTVGAIAIPVVLTLTAAEQKAYAFQTLSGTTSTTHIIV